MLNWTDLKKRTFGNLQHVHPRILEVMREEMEAEVLTVVPEGREMAARRNGLAAVRGALHHAKGNQYRSSIETSVTNATNHSGDSGEVRRFKEFGSDHSAGCGNSLQD